MQFHEGGWVGFFTLRNLMILALAQTGVLVAAVLGGGIAHKYSVAMTFHGSGPPLSGNLIAYGWIGLAIPFAWFSLGLYVMRNEERAPEWVKLCILVVGLLVLAAFLVTFWRVAALPLLQVRQF